jgi:predicted ATPase
LRDVAVPVDLRQLGTGTFPPLPGRSAAATTLPSPRTSLVGRDEAVDEVRALLGEHRPVTLIGAGGCGKTRLAIEVAHREVSVTPDDVWFVDLVPVTDDAGVLGELAATIGVTMNAAGLEPAGKRLDALAEFLNRDALVVIDNCEHVIDAAAELVDSLLERDPRLRILTTSRESLDCEGEFAWRVPPLGTGTGAPAAQLFVERALAAGAELPQSAEADTLIAEIVDALDGLPLAIELAAARTRSMDLAELRRGLDDRFRMLGTSGRRRRPRQATLEAAVQWSYDLLAPAEQSLLQMLSVFHGGFDRAGVVGVTGLGEAEVVDRIDSLVAKSLVDAQRDGSGTSRHRLLETIRLFAASRLEQSGDADAIRDRHLEHYRHDRRRRVARPLARDGVGALRRA